MTCLQTGVALNGVNVPHIAPSEAARVAPFVNLAQNLSSFLTQVYGGELTSLRLTLQGELPASAARPLAVAVLAGALRGRTDGPVTPVNAERTAEAMGVRMHTDTSSFKRDFVNLVRIEAVLGGTRHHVTGTVLGHRHGRMIEFDDLLLDAIPEGPLLVTFHRDAPGVLGRIGTILGEADTNVSRLQLGGPCGEDSLALGIWNLSSPLTEAALQRVVGEPAVERAHRVD